MESTLRKKYSHITYLKVLFWVLICSTYIVVHLMMLYHWTYTYMDLKKITLRKEVKANDRSAELQTKNEVEECVVDVIYWMDQLRLKMNSAKTEFIHFGSRIQLIECVVTHLNVNGVLVERATLIKYLGAWLDAQFPFKEHATKSARQ